MGKVYKQGIASPKGFNLTAGEPVDQREIVEFYTDLSSLANTYVGIEVKVVENNYEKYKLMGLPSSLLSNWLVIAPGVGPAGPQGEPGIDGADGADGPTGPTGAAGTPGSDGQGIPVAGNIGQALVKAGITDYDTKWATIELAQSTNYRESLALGRDFIDANNSSEILTDFNDAVNGGVHATVYIEEFNKWFVFDRTSSPSVYIFEDLEDLTSFTKIDVSKVGYTGVENASYNASKGKIYFSISDNTYSQTDVLIKAIDVSSNAVTTIIEYNTGINAGAAVCASIGDFIYVMEGNYGWKFNKFDTAGNFIDSIVSGTTVNIAHSTSYNDTHLYISTFVSYNEVYQVIELDLATFTVTQLQSVIIPGGDTGGGTSGFTNQSTLVGPYIYIGTENFTTNYIVRLDKDNLSSYQLIDVRKNAITDNIYTTKEFQEKLYYAGSNDLFGYIDLKSGENALLINPFPYSINEISVTNEIMLFGGFDVYPVSGTGFVAKGKYFESIEPNAPDTTEVVNNNANITGATQDDINVNVEANKIGKSGTPDTNSIAIWNANDELFGEGTLEFDGQNFRMIDDDGAGFEYRTSPNRAFHMHGNENISHFVFGLQTLIKTITLNDFYDDNSTEFEFRGGISYKWIDALGTTLAHINGNYFELPLWTLALQEAEENDSKRVSTIEYVRDYVSNNSGSGDVSKVGTPVDNQIGVWTGDGTLEGDSNFTWDASNGMFLDDRGITWTGDDGVETGLKISYGWASGTVNFDAFNYNTVYFKSGGKTSLELYGETIQAPSTEIADITLDKQLVTKEYAEANFAGLTGVALLDTANDFTKKNTFFAIEISSDGVGELDFNIDQYDAELYVTSEVFSINNDNNLIPIPFVFKSNSYSIVEFHADTNADNALLVLPRTTISYQNSQNNPKSVTTREWVQAEISAGGYGNVSKVGTPVNNQIGVWTGDGTLEGVSTFRFEGTTLGVRAGTILTGTQNSNALDITDATGTTSTQFNLGIHPVTTITASANRISALQLQNKLVGTAAEMRFITAADDDTYLAFTAPSSANTGQFFGETKSTGHFIFNTGARNLVIGAPVGKSLIFGSNNVKVGNFDSTGDFNVLNDLSVTGAISGSNLSGTNTGDNATNTLYSGLVTNATHTGDVTGDVALTIAAGAVDIAMLSATGTPSATNFLRGDNTWATPAGSGNVSTAGTPVINDFARFTGSTDIEGRSYAEVKADLNLEIGTDIDAIGTDNSDNNAVNTLYADDYRAANFVAEIDYSAQIHSNITALNAVSGTNTGDQTTIVGISSTKAQFNTAVSDGTILYSGDVTSFPGFSTLSGDYGYTEPTHSWSEITSKPTTLSGFGISDTKANFNTTLSDGSFLFVGDAPTSHTHTASDITDFDTEVANNTAVTANTAKDTNVTTNLEYTASPTNGIVTSSDGTDATLTLATGTNAGLMNPTYFTNLANTSGTNTGGNTGDNATNSQYSGLVSNVTTNLSEGTSTETTVDVNSSDGTNATLVSASTSRAGLLTKAKWDEIVANTAKDTNVTQTITLTGDVNGSGTGSFAATIQPDSVTMDKIVDIATDTFLGRVTAATGTVEVLTNTQAKTALDLTGTNSGDEPAASTTVAGIVELAIASEVDTGTSTTLAITPDALEGSALQATVDILDETTINAQTGTTYTFVDSDKNKMVTLDNAAAITVTVSSALSLAIGAKIHLIQKGAGQVTVAVSSTTVNTAATLKLRAQWSSATLLQIAADVWVLIGDLEAA